MATLNLLKSLSTAHCVLLAVRFATEANIAGLQALTALRDTDFPLELTLSILLSYLPEELQPSRYAGLLNDIANNNRHPGDDPAANVDTTSVRGLSDSQAKRRRQQLDLLPLVHPLYSSDTELDTFSLFLIHRAHRIDSQAGLLDLIPELVAPFLSHSEYLRSWFISTILPLLRLSYEYYPQVAPFLLDEFARISGKYAIDFQLSHASCSGEESGIYLARDLKGVVAPWLCGASDRKRRKRSSNEHDPAIQSALIIGDDWDSLFKWLLQHSKDNFPSTLTAFTQWDGPEDMDLGGFEEGRDYVDDAQQRRLELKFAQTALACLYLGTKDDEETLRSAHILLKRLADLLNFDPPATVSDATLPSFDKNSLHLAGASTSMLHEDHLLEPENQMTTPNKDTVQLAEFLLLSSAILIRLQQPLTMKAAAMIFFRQDAAEQKALVQKVTHALGSGTRKTKDEWNDIREKLLWLWAWRPSSDNSKHHGLGLFGAVERDALEVEILKALLGNAHYTLAIQTYVQPTNGHQPLPASTVERTILESAMHQYDNASNGNRTRGGVKRAGEIVTTFAPHFPHSSQFRRMQNLLSATHAMSFYSLILQHGVPLQPVDVRVTSNTLMLVQKLLAQNSGSYTKLDDLISIGQNLVLSMPSTILRDEVGYALDKTSVEWIKSVTERRVIGMAIDAALEEDDFETAYSYVVNRLTPPTPSPTPSISPRRFSFDCSGIEAQEVNGADDVAWRAALRAGRYNSPSKSWTRSNRAQPGLRRLEQRMELLSQALLLAPSDQYEEILKVWQACETEMTNLLAQENEAEQQFNDAADRKLPGTFLNETIAEQPRREIGRAAVEEAPMGLFDVARGAAAAFSKTAFPLRGSTQNATNNTSRDLTNTLPSNRVSMDLSDSSSLAGHDDRVRKRDMVANAASGALASGLGWVLGAKPVAERERE